jgi:hypothetical protein
VVITETCGETDEVLTGAKYSPPSRGDTRVSWTCLLFPVRLSPARREYDSETKATRWYPSCTAPVPNAPAAVRIWLSPTEDLGISCEVAAGSRPGSELVDESCRIQTCLLDTALAATTCRIVSNTNAFIFVVCKAQS